MSRKPISATLSRELNQAVIQRIIEGRDSDRELLAWLKSQGMNSFSVSSFNRYCAEIRRKLKSFGRLRVSLELSPPAIAKHFDKLNELTGLYAEYSEIEARIDMLEDFLGNVLYEKAG